MSPTASTGAPGAVDSCCLKYIRCYLLSRMAVGELTQVGTWCMCSCLLSMQT